MKWHIIEGEAGCRYAVGRGCTAVVVDALRASATAAMLLDAGASGILVVKEVEEALEMKESMPDALLFGERGGLPPDGFDFGNSPRTVKAARGRSVIFTTTTGAQRLVDCWGAAAVCMGTTVNAGAVLTFAMEQRNDVVLIPAGLSTDPTFDAQEDWVAAATIAMRAGAEVVEGAERYRYWFDRIKAEGVPALFDSAPHADKLRKVGLQEDIAYCGGIDLTTALPLAKSRQECGILVEDGQTTKEG